jgi:glycosyltransferase involved in cell wall biosynthesis
MLAVTEPTSPLRPAPAAARVVVAIPALNEEASIADVVAGIPPALVSRVIVADGGSRDATAARAQAAGAQVIDAGKGYGRACWRATKAAHEADIMVFMDGDGADDPSSIAAMIAPIRLGAFDFVIASRARGAREPGSMASHQLLAGLVAGRLTEVLYGVRYTDMCAFRAIRRDTLLGLGMQEMTYGWNLEMQLRAARSGLRVLELPVPYRRRLGGESKVAGSLRGSMRAGLKIISTFARVAMEPARRRAS